MTSLTLTIFWIDPSFQIHHLQSQKLKKFIFAEKKRLAICTNKRHPQYVAFVDKTEYLNKDCLF